MIILKALYSIFFYTYAIFMLIVISTAGYITSIFMKDRQEWLFEVSRFWSKRLILPLAARVKITGLEHIPKKQPVIFMPNHQSYFDIPALIGYIPGTYRFIVKKEYYKIPVLGPYTKHSGHLSVDREAGTEAHKTLEEAKEMIKNGKSIIIFPEGTRSQTGALGKFKRGGFAVAFASGAPIIPVAITGSYSLLDKGIPLVTPGTINIKIGKPIHLKAGEVTREIYKSTVDFVRAEIEKMMQA
jgi:1-acyl-sn-glycerol-3-phosphate acyltransferase